MHSLQSEADSQTPTFRTRKFIAAGKSAIVYATDDDRILKEYYPGNEDNEIDIEREAFMRLGSHPNIVQYLGAVGDSSIILERGQPLRDIINGSDVDQIPLETKLRWIQDAAEGMQYMHEKKILHADIGCHNMIIVQDRLKIIDFEGASIDGREATAQYAWYSYRPSIPIISEKTEIFAFGCAIYEIITGRPPYYFLASMDSPSRLVQQRYANNEYPDVEHLPLCHVMQDCWYGNFNSTKEVLVALQAANLSLIEQTNTQAFSIMD